MPPTPNLKDILHQVIMQVYVLPHLPPSLYTLAYPRKTPAPMPSDGSIPSLVAAGSLSGSSGSSSAGDASTISGLSGGSSQQPPPTTGRGAYVTNLQSISSVVTLDKPGLIIRDMIRSTSPPKMNDRTDICLSYHLWKGCCSNCHRATNHGKFLLPVEVQCLEQYIVRQIATVPPPTNPLPQAAGAPTPSN